MRRKLVVIANWCVASALAHFTSPRARRTFLARLELRRNVTGSTVAGSAGFCTDTGFTFAQCWKLVNTAFAGWLTLTTWEFAGDFGAEGRRPLGLRKILTEPLPTIRSTHVHSPPPHDHRTLLRL